MSTATKPEVTLCGNEDHHLDVGEAIPAAIVNVSWPDGRFKPVTACQDCLAELIGRTVLGDEDDRCPITIEPIATSTAEPAAIPSPAFTHRAYGVDVDWFGDDGGMIARGHVPELRFVAACNHMARTQGKLRNVWDDPSVTLDAVLVETTQCWGLPIDPAESSNPDSDWALRYDQTVTEQTPGAIAVTVLAP